MFLSKYSLDRNNIIASLFRTQYTPDFLIAEYYGLRNTIFWVTKDLASVCSYLTQHTKLPVHLPLPCFRVPKCSIVVSFSYRQNHFIHPLNYVLPDLKCHYCMLVITISQMCILFRKKLYKSDG
jgi:hypothetical protein